MSRKQTQRQLGERLVEVCRNAVHVINEMTGQGRDYESIRELLTPCMDARSAIGSVLYKINHSQEKRQHLIQGFRMAADYLETHRDPADDFAEAWVVEVLVIAICDRFQNYIKYETRDRKGPVLNLEGYASYYLGAADEAERCIGEGLVQVCEISSGKLHAEYKSKPVTMAEAAVLPKNVHASDWDEQDLHRLAERQRAAD